jgi:hypothetical protein
VLGGAALVLTGCASGAAQPILPVAAVRSAPSAAPPASAARTVAPVATPTPAATPPASEPARAAGAPGPRFGPAMAYDGADQSLLLFGGETTGQSRLADTWTWDGHRWTQLHPAHSPSPRAWAQMAYDPRHRDVLLFGGSSGLADTWIWNGGDWTRASPAFSPGFTQEEGMTFFAGTGTVLMYSGNFMGPNHVYSWDGTNWTDLPFTGGPPPSAFQGGFSIDPTRQVVVLLAYDVNQKTLQHWEFDGRIWTHRSVVTPPTRSLVQTATDDRTGTIVMFGGVGHNDTWTWNGKRWTQQDPERSPSQRSSTGPMPGMAYDAANGEVVVFGGIDVTTNVPLNDTWTWNGEDWTSR